MAHRSRARSQSGPATPKFKRVPMTATEVRHEYEKAVDEWNHFAMKNKHEAALYKEEFDKSRNIRNPYEKAGFLEHVTLGKHRKHFMEATRLLNALFYWQQKCAQYRVDDAVLTARPDDMPYWMAMLDDASPLNRQHMPTKGQVFDMGKGLGAASGAASGSGRKRSSVVKITKK